MNVDRVRAYLLETSRTASLTAEACSEQIIAAAAAIVGSVRDGGKLLICGNGGSAADAEHLVGELMKGYLSARPAPAALKAALEASDVEAGPYLASHLQGALPAISLASHSALTSAIANDIGADMVFAQQVYGYGRPGDVLAGLSTSGNSKNVLLAARVARVLGLRTLALTGPAGRLREICDVAVCVPLPTTAEIQERHLAIYHTWCAMLEETFFG